MYRKVLIRIENRNSNVFCVDWIGVKTYELDMITYIIAFASFLTICILQEIGILCLPVEADK